MRESTKSKLNKVLNWTIPITLTGGLVLASELLGFSEALTKYDQAKIPLVYQYFGKTIGDWQNVSISTSRLLADTVVALIGLYSGIKINEIRDYFKKDKPTPSSEITEE